MAPIPLPSSTYFTNMLALGGITNSDLSYPQSGIEIIERVSEHINRISSSFMISKMYENTPNVPDSLKPYYNLNLSNATASF